MSTRRIVFAIFLAGSIVIASTAASQEPAATARQIEVTEIGTVHSLPSPMLDVLGSVTPGQRFTVYATSGPEWYKIDFNGKVGYIPKAIAKLMPRTTAPRPQTPAKPSEQAIAKSQPEAAAQLAKPTQRQAKPPAVTSEKKPMPAAEQPVEQKLDAEDAEPVSVAPPTEVTGKAEPLEVTAKSGSHATRWLIIGAAIFVVLVFLLIHFERPEESANEFLHHKPS
jgi:hypothetical protein